MTPERWAEIRALYGPDDKGTMADAIRDLLAHIDTLAGLRDANHTEPAPPKPEVTP